MISNIADHLQNAKKRIQMRQTALFFKARSGWGARVAKRLGLEREEVEEPAGLTKEERERATAGGTFGDFS